MLQIRNISVFFYRYSGFVKKHPIQVIRSLDLDIKKGEIHSVVGSSGSGKSLLAHAILGILPGNALCEGEILFKGIPLTKERIQKIRGREIALVPQSVGFLNPLCEVGSQVVHSARIKGYGRKQSVFEMDKVFMRYGLGHNVKELYPFQVSGGMARRILTGIATIDSPDLLVADEPTSGLDPEASSQSLSCLRELADSGKSILLITHDIDSALTISDSVSVFYAGTTLETARPSDFKKKGKLRHPYTRALWNALPANNFSYTPGRQPSPGELVPGCPYEPRCGESETMCKHKMPDSVMQNHGRVRCYHA